MRLKHLDSLKIFFCVTVVLWHYYDELALHNITGFLSIIPETIYEYGYLGVEFFFILSGFFVSYKYKDKLMKKELEISTFIKKRFFSLYPMYFVCCFFGMIIILLDMIYSNSIATGRTINIPSTFFTFTMLSDCLNIDNICGYGLGAWFVEVLFICYFLYAIITKNAKTKFNYIMYVIVFTIIGLYCTTGINFLCFNISIGRGIFSFFAGCILYEVQINIDEKKQKIIAYIDLIILLVIACTCKIMKNIKILQDIRLSCVLFIFPSIIFICNNINIIKKILSNKIIVKISSFSTSIYFVHLALFRLLKIITIKYSLTLNYCSPLIFIVVMTGTLIIAILFKVLIENKLTNYIKHKLILKDS